MVTPLTRVQYPQTQTGEVLMTGGLNESVNNLELQPGELIHCLNYMEVDGPYHGYRSFPGYEIFDGSAPAPSAVDLVPSDIAADDADREIRRLAITQPEGKGGIRGIHVYRNEVYAARDDRTGPLKTLSKSSLGGWAGLQNKDQTYLLAGGNCKFINAIFSKYPTSAPNTEAMFGVDGVSPPFAFFGTEVESLQGGDLPPTSAPRFLAEFDNRLWLAYPGGQLFYSELGDPAGWDGQDGAGQITTGGEITGLVVGAGNVLVIFMEHMIKVLYIAERPTGDFAYQLKEFSQRSGCLPGICDRLWGNILFVDDRGPSVLTSTDRFGDLSESPLTLRVQRTFYEFKHLIQASVVQRELNQWRVFFSNGVGLCFTFLNTRLKSATLFKYPAETLCVCEGKDEFGRIQLYLGDANGNVYHLDSGTSFNGESIVTRMVTSYAPYRSPRRNKRFMRLTFELDAEPKTELWVRTDYDYHWMHNPKNIPQTFDLGLPGGIWGESRWHNFVWGGAHVQNPTLYIEGYGVNMSIAMWSNSKYRQPHIVYNALADFDPVGLKM